MQNSVLFLDLNGTLVNDWDASHAGVCACFHAEGIPPPSLDAYIRCVAKDGDYKHFYETYGSTADRDTLYQTYIPAYRACIGGNAHARVFDGVHDTLEILRSRGVEIHLITAARHDMAMWLISACHITPWCTSIHCHVHNKEAQIHAIIDGMALDRKSCAMMGDLPSDILHAKRAGIRGIAFRNPDVPSELFADTDMDYAILQFQGLLELYPDPRHSG